jgi:hypothetical protein
MKKWTVLVALTLLVACTSTAQPPAPTRTPAPVTSPRIASGTATSRIASGTATRSPSPAPRFDSAAALRTVRTLAADIGPREATTPAYRRAASYVAGQLRDLGYDVRRQEFRVPSGVSWGIRVPAGRTHNVLALPQTFDPARPHLIVGAHLDTVPQAPGAEDNASGVAVLVELARLAAAQPPTTPVVFVAFAAEEPRGPADDEHHFGSGHYVSRMSPTQRRALTGMVSLDRVGVGRTVRVCTGGRSPTTLARHLRATAARIKVPTTACENRTSDHWPFEKAGETAARVGGHPYAAYHSARDRPGVVQPAQLDRTGRVMWEFLRTTRS